MYWQAGNGLYPDGNFRGLYGAGDLAGLATNGLGQGCFRKVRSFRERRAGSHPGSPAAALAAPALTPRPGLGAPRPAPVAEVSGHGRPGKGLG